MRKTVCVVKEWAIPKIHATTTRRCARPDPGGIRRHGTNNYKVDIDSKSRSYLT